MKKLKVKKRDAKSSIAARFLGNTGWMMFKNIYSMLVSLIVGSLSARYLGPSNFGLLNYGSSIISFFTTVSKLGMDSVLVAEMARNPEKEDSYLGTAFVMRFVTSVLSFFMIGGIVMLLEPDNKLLQIVTVLQAIAIIFQSSEVLFFWFQVRLEMKYITLASMLALTVTGVWRISLLASEASVQWFALSSSISALVCGVYTIYFFVKKAGRKLKFSFHDAKFILDNSYHFIINGLAVTIYTQLDRIMLGKVVSDEAVGIYSAASTLAVMWEFVPLALINSARPLLVKEYDNHKEKFIQKYRWLLLGITVMGILVGIFFNIFGGLFIYILYGKQYAEAAQPLSILIWSTSFAMIGSARTIWIVAERKNKYTKYFTIIGAIVNAATNALVIPIWGVTGAAYTTLAAQIIVSLVSPVFYKDTRSFLSIYFGSFKETSNLWKFTKGMIKKEGHK